MIIYKLLELFWIFTVIFSSSVIVRNSSFFSMEIHDFNTSIKIVLVKVSESLRFSALLQFRLAQKSGKAIRRGVTDGQT